MNRRYARKLARRSTWRPVPEPVADPVVLLAGLVLAAFAVLVWGWP